jgi:hypothetical protein
MPTDASHLPATLIDLAQAIDFSTTRSLDATGYVANGFPEAPHHPREEGQPPYDGVYRASFVSTAICVRLDLQHPSVPAELRQRLVHGFPQQIGKDQAFYEYSVDEHVSQRINLGRALASLARKSESSQGE